MVLSSQYGDFKLWPQFEVIIYIRYDKRKKARRVVKGYRVLLYGPVECIEM
jgi:hypothetical protein